jgi:hypothetical protein
MHVATLRFSFKGNLGVATGWGGGTRLVSLDAGIVALLSLWLLDSGFTRRWVTVCCCCGIFINACIVWVDYGCR